MLFKTAILLLIFLIGLTQVVASRVDENFIVLNTEETTNEAINGEEAAASTRDASVFEGNVECSGDHRADINSCRQLITSLSNDGGRVLANSPRDVCLTQSGDKCCVSWSKVANGLQKSDLVNSANKVFDQCNTGSQISGLERGVELHGTTGVTQCLSNREDGCS